MEKHLHFLAIGSELVSGEVSDTNGSWLANWLSKKSAKLSSITILPDNELIIESFLQTLNFSKDQLIISGGLGPTKDDKTKYIISDFFSHPLIESQDALELVKSQYNRSGKEYKESGYKLIPKRWRVIDNPIGLACGLVHPQSLVILLPGVPGEFQAMIEKHGIELLNLTSFPASQRQTRAKKHVRFFGLSEEKIFFELAPRLWSELEKWGDVSCLPKFPRVDIGLTPSKDKPELTSQGFQDIINNHLFEYAPDFNRQPIEQNLVEYLQQSKMSVATAESCTGGLCAHMLTQVSGASQVFQGGLICYSEQAKINMLNISEKIIDTYSVYSHQIVEQMAQNLCKKMNCNIGIATSGIAGPSGGTKYNPVGSVYIGICINGKTQTFQRVFRGDRSILKERFASWALLLTYQHLLFS